VKSYSDCRLMATHRLGSKPLSETNTPAYFAGERQLDNVGAATLSITKQNATLSIMRVLLHCVVLLSVMAPQGVIKSEKV
jgi:hypothetical protein